MNAQRLFFLILNVLITTSVSALIIGSNSTVSIPVFTTFPALDTDNEIRGFAYLRNGFALENNLTDCLFNALFPVSGDIDLNGGTLTLSEDLFIKLPASILSFGTIVGNNHIIDFGITLTYFNFSTATIGNINLFFKDDIVYDSQITFTGDCLIDGGNNTAKFTNAADILIDSDSTLLFRNVVLTDLSGTKIRCADSSSKLIFDTVEVILSDTFNFNAGCIEIRDDVTVRGEKPFVYDSDSTSTIKSDSRWIFKDNVTLQIGRKGPLLIDPIYFEDKNSTLSFDQASLTITGSGFSIKRGKVEFNKEVTLDILSTGTPNGFILGNNDINKDSTIFFDANAKLIHKSGFIVYENVGPQQIISNSLSSQLVRTVNSNIFLAHSFNFPEFTVVNETITVPTVQTNTGVTISHTETVIRTPLGEAIVRNLQSNDIYLILVGNSVIDVTRGVLGSVLLVSGTNNEITGGGGTFSPIIYSTPTATLKATLQGSIASDVTLNGGLFTLGGNLILGPGVEFIGDGTVDLSLSTLKLHQQPSTWNTPLLWKGNGGEISLNGTLSLASTWTFQGSTIINGNGNIVELDEDGEIIIDDGATLTFKNINISGIKDNKIRCLTDLSNLVMQDVTWTQTSTFTFSRGSIQFIGENKLIGENEFVYDSTQSSTISSNSQLKITNRLRFHVGKKLSTSVEPIIFEDKTSNVVINNACLVITGEGAQFTRGTMITEKDIEIEVNSTSTSNGLILGNGMVNEDIIFEISPGSVVRFTKGHIVADFDKGDSIRSQSETAQFFRSANTTFFLKSDVNLSNLTLLADSAAVLTVDTGKTLSYSDVTIGTTEGTFEISGNRFAFGVNQLNGNQTIFMDRGVLEFFTLITGTNNRLQGNGSIGGEITFLNSSASLNYGVDGLTLNNITLNGGTLTLEHNLNFAKDISILVGGTVNMEKFNVNFGPGDLIWISPIAWVSKGGSINLDAKVTLANDWTFSGTGIIDGNANILDLGTGNIFVAANSTLKLKNIEILGPKNSNISCLASTAKLILEDVTWIQQAGEDFVYSVGALDFKSDVMLTGSGSKFTYQSGQQATILDDSKLKLDENFTFSYDPTSIVSKTLLGFENGTSLLEFTGGTLHTTVTGLSLTKGSILVKRDSSISSEIEEIINIDTDEVIKIDEGITFGNNTTSADLLIQIFPGVTLTCKQGSIQYRNVNDSSWFMANNLSELLMKSNTKLVLSENLNLKEGRLTLQDIVVIAHVTGKELTGFVNPRGRYFIQELK